MSRVMSKLTPFLCALVLAAACGKKEEAAGAPPPVTKPAAGPAVAAAPAPAADPAARARELFTSQCAVCHGASGKGDGAGAASLDPKPRDYTDQAWQAATDDARIKKIILEGGAANGLAAAMPPYGGMLASEPAVLDELVKLIRSFGG